MVHCNVIALYFAICFISFAYGTGLCSSGPDDKLQINCADDENPAKIFCCRLKEVRCCDENEFQRELEESERYDADNSASKREKREYSITYAHDLTDDSGLGPGGISGIIGALLLPIMCIACCCWCCSCCPCYRRRHLNVPTTSVTIIQPSGYPVNPVSNNFSFHVPPTQPAMAMPKDPPPQYTRGGYTNLQENSDSNYIQ